MVNVLLRVGRAVLGFTCHCCGQGDHGNCAGGRNKGGLCDCCPNRD